MGSLVKGPGKWLPQLCNILQVIKIPLQLLFLPEEIETYSDREVISFEKIQNTVKTSASLSHSHGWLVFFLPLHRGTEGNQAGHLKSPLWTPWRKISEHRRLSRTCSKTRGEIVLTVKRGGKPQIMGSPSEMHIYLSTWSHIIFWFIFLSGNDKQYVKW